MPSLIGQSFDEALVLIVGHFECSKQIGILCLEFLVFDDISLFFSGVMIVLYLVSLQFPFEHFHMFDSFPVFSGQSCNNLFDFLNFFSQSDHTRDLIKFGSFSRNFHLQFLFVFEQGQRLVVLFLQLRFFLIAWLVGAQTLRTQKTNDGHFWVLEMG